MFSRLAGRARFLSAFAFFFFGGFFAFAGVFLFAGFFAFVDFLFVAMGHASTMVL